MILVPISIASGGGLIDLDSTIAIQLVIFLFVFFVLRQLLFRPLIRLIEARRTATDGVFSQAKDFEEEAVAMSAEVEEKLGKARAAAGAKRERMLDEARRKERQILGTARDETQSLLETAKKDAADQAAVAEQTLKSEAGAFANALAARVLGRAI